MKRYQLLGLVLSAGMILAVPSKAVILYGTDDPSANTTAPTGELAGSGWQYEGLFSGFLGTVIASNYFVTANHIGGNVGEQIFFNGNLSATTAVLQIQPAISPSGRSQGPFQFRHRSIVVRQVVEA